MCSLVEGEGAHIRYLFCAQSDSVSVSVTHTLSQMNIAQKIPECKVLSCVFPPWHLAENCQRAFAALFLKCLNGTRSRGCFKKRVYSIFSKTTINFETAYMRAMISQSSLQSSCYLSNYSLNQNQVKSMLRFLFCLNLGSDPNRHLLITSFSILVSEVFQILILIIQIQ